MTEATSTPLAAGNQAGRRLMLVRAMLAQNVGTGCAFGGIGVSVLALQERFASTLGTATLGLSLAVFSMTAFGPVIAGFIGRWGLRAVMIAGVVVSFLGYVSLAYAPSMPLALAACFFLIGPGAALFAVLPPAVLASGWYPHDRGKATGIAFLPLFVTFIPVVAVSIIQRYGLTSFYLFLAALHALLLPIMLGVVDPPAEAGDASAAAETAGSGHIAILATAIFWWIAFGDGILNGTAVAGAAHLLPIVLQYGVSLETGAILLAVSGATSIGGSLLAGYACDRIGPARTLGITGLGFALAWTLLGLTGWLPSLTVAAGLVGVCGASVFPPISALVVRIFGAQALPKVLGLLGVMSLPFTFLMSPAAGWLKDLTGGYGAAVAMLAGSCVIAAGTFFLMSRRVSWTLAPDTV